MRPGVICTCPRCNCDTVGDCEMIDCRCCNRISENPGVVYAHSEAYSESVDEPAKPTLISKPAVDRGTHALKCPECGSGVSPQQERCNYCGVWFKNSTPPTISAMMAESDKPRETVSYYGDAYMPGDSGIGLGLSGDIILSPSTSGGVVRVIKKSTGVVVEETSEYVILLTRKDQLVKIRPEDIVQRKVLSPSDSESPEWMKWVWLCLGLGAFMLFVMWMLSLAVASS